MNINKIKEEVNIIFTKHNLVLYGIEQTKIGNDEGITILIDNVINTNELEPIHMEVLNQIENLLPDDYYLELSTVGLERPLKSLDELKKNVGSYIYLESNKYNGNATLESVLDEKLEISYFVKGRPKKEIIDYSQAKNIRKAVKF